MEHDDVGMLLDQMRAALMAGDLSALPGLTERTQAALTRVAAGEERPERRLSHLSHKAQRNAACLRAAIEGVRAARARLAEIATQGGSMGYDGNGRRVCAPQTTGVVRRV